MSLSKMVTWIFASKDPMAEKHWKTWSHALLTMGAVWSASAGIALLAGDSMQAPSDDEAIVRASVWRKRGMMLGAYLATLVAARARDNGPIALYEFPWACNVSMMLTVLGLVLPKQRPNLVGAAMASCCADQVFWYVDFLSYALTGKFVVGVAGYMVWPQTSLVTKLTSLHHLWFIPFIAAYISEQSGTVPPATAPPLLLTKEGGAVAKPERASGPAALPATAVARTPGAFDAKTSYTLSMCGVVVCSILSRIMTPYEVWSPKLQAIKYMNVNLSYEMWRDVKLKLLHVLDGVHPIIFTPALLVFYNFINGPIYVALLASLAALRRRAGSRLSRKLAF